MIQSAIGLGNLQGEKYGAFIAKTPLNFNVKTNLQTTSNDLKALGIVMAPNL